MLLNMRRAIPLFHDKQELTMKTTLKTLSALAIAAATLTAVTLATGGGASANPFRGLGHGPVILHGNGNLRAPSIGGRLAGHLKITCFACNLPRPKPPHWGSYPWRFPHWGYYPGRYHNWGFRYSRWYWERYRDRFGFRGHPGEVVSAAPAVSAPAQASAGPQGCLTEQKMPDGSVMFADVCKQISALAPPPSADPRQ
jgi:hypothetical protein